MSRKAKSPDGIRGFANACMGRGGNSAGPLGDRPQQQVLVLAFELTVCFADARANNTIHGGAVMAFADSVGAAATVINLPEDAKGTTTLESKTNFIGGAKEGTTVVATATPVHRGRRTQVWTTRLETEEGKLVAIVTQTQMVL